MGSLIKSEQEKTLGPDVTLTANKDFIKTVGDISGTPGNLLDVRVQFEVKYVEALSSDKISVG